jgi:hypothetical protein
MRRLLVLAALLLGVLIPTVAGAQNGTIINEIKVRLWPEYDRSDLLVIYDFALAPGTVTPTTLKIRVPADADVTALAQDTTSGLFEVPFKTAVEGDWQTVTFEVADLLIDSNIMCLFRRRIPRGVSPSNGRAIIPSIRWWWKPRSLHKPPASPPLPRCPTCNRPPTACPLTVEPSARLARARPGRCKPVIPARRMS